MLPLLGALTPIISKVLDRILPEDSEKRREAEMQMNAALLENAHQLESAAAGIIEAEARSDHKITSQWRPLLMLSFTAIIVNNYILAPYLQALFGFSVILDLPDHMWQLLNIGVGGYVIGRSGEKMTRNWKS